MKKYNKYFDFLLRKKKCVIKTITFHKSENYILLIDIYWLVYVDS